MVKTNDVFLFNPRRSLRWMKLERQGNQSYTEKLEECKDITGMCVKDEYIIHIMRTILNINCFIDSKRLIRLTRQCL